MRIQKNIMYVKNYINKPKENGYSAIHIRYRNEYNSCPISQMECQLYLINDYYESLYGKAKNYKNYSMINYE
jgi:ppGpp synthetase/RelA/SpoT-type nucleotidyltranferase